MDEDRWLAINASSPGERRRDQKPLPPTPASDLFSIGPTSPL
jgi:hypothetical protein